MVILRKAKKVLLKATTAYSLAEMPKFRAIMQNAGASSEQVDKMVNALNTNAFGLAIHGAQIRLGAGYIVECK